MKRAADLFFLATWCALLTGLAEVALLLRARYVLGRDIYVSREFVWMAPAGNVILFAAIALLLLLLSRLTPRAARAGTAATLFIIVGGISVLTFFPKLAWWAVVTLALGVGLRGGQLVGAHEERVRRLVARTLPVLAALTVVLGVGWHLRLERKARSAQVPRGTPAAGAPNVLVIVWDAVRADDLSLYGYARRTTPHLDRFAAGGATFEQAMSPASYTLPGHASLFTGLWPHQLSVTWNIGLSRDVPTLTDVMTRHGYRTGAFAANHIYVAWEHGLLRGFDEADDYPMTLGQVIRTPASIRWMLGFKDLRTAIHAWNAPGRRDAEEIRTAFLDWLDESDSTRPFYAFLNLLDAHDPYLPREPFDTLFGFPAGAGDAERHRVRVQALLPHQSLTAADMRRQRDQYDGAIAEMDESFGRLLAALEQRGRLRNTLVVLTSDHGEAFGEHGIFAHGNALHREEIHIPLVMVLPDRIPSGVRLTGIASLRDVPATILDALRLSDPGHPLPGRSLAPRWMAAASAGGHDTVLAEIERIPRGAPDWYPVMRGHNRSIIAWPWQLIRVGTSIELYDLAADFGEQVNQADQPAHAATRDALLAALDRWRQDAVPTKR